MRALLNSEGAHVFENAYCAAPDCGPSRTAMLTGLRPKTTGFTDNSARPLEESGVWKDWTTLAKAFSNALQLLVQWRLDALLPLWVGGLVPL